MPLGGVQTSATPTASQQANRLLAEQGGPGQYTTAGSYQVLGGPRPSGVNGILNSVLGGSGGSGGGAYVGNRAAVGGGSPASQFVASQGGGNVVPPPGTGGGPGPVQQNYKQQANPFLTQMNPLFEAQQQRLQSLYNEDPADMFAKMRANQSTMRNEQQQQAGQRGGMGMTNAGNWNVNRAEQQQLSQMGLDWKNMSLQNKQAAAGLMGSNLGMQSGNANNIAGNQVQQMQNQIAGNRLGLDAWMAPQQLEVQKIAAQNQGRSSMLSALFPYLQLQSQL
jgi:hypothetical protein